MTLHIGNAQIECHTDTVSINQAPIGLVNQRLLRFPSRPYDDSRSQDITANVHLDCIENQATVISVSIPGAGDQDDLKSIPGFTASFTQIGQPKILRLKPIPYAYLEDETADWLLPDTERELVVVESSDSAVGSPEDLEKESLKLASWKPDFSNCSSIKCYFRTVFQKVPVLAHLIANHFRHHAHIGPDFSQHGTHTNCSDTQEQLITQPDDSSFGYDENEDYHVAEKVQDTTHPLISPVRSVDVALPTATWSSTLPEVPQETHSTLPPSDDADDPPAWAGHHQPPWGKGPPPWAKPGNTPPSEKGPPPWVKPGSTPPWSQPGSKPPWQGHEDHSHSHGSQQLVPTLTSQQIWRIHLIGALIGLLVVLLFTACLFTCIKHRTRIFRDPRRRAEILALREEWLTKRAYRKAACKHKWRTFVRGIWWTRKPEEGEKHTMLAGEDDVVVVDRQIKNLQAAHRLVGDMMRAEQGESTFTASSSTRSRSESLPSYTSGPPDYTSGQEGDISVIDGFTGYTPSNTDETPESSVVDCSPRMSFETQRTS